MTVYALSYDLILGATSLLSFGHAMVFAVGAYLTGIMLESFGWGFLPTLGLAIAAGIVGTWHQKSFEIKQGRERLVKLFSREKSPKL